MVTLPVVFFVGAQLSVLEGRGARVEGLWEDFVGFIFAFFGIFSYESKGANEGSRRGDQISRGCQSLVLTTYSSISQNPSLQIQNSISGKSAAQI